MAELDSTIMEPGARANPQPIPASEYRGRLRIAQGRITADAAQNDTVRLFEIDAHATLSTVISKLAFSALGAGVTLDIGFKADASIIMANGSGYAGDVDAIADGIDVSGAGTATFFGAQAAANYGKKIWELAGIDSGDPGKRLTVIGTFLGANPASGTVAFEQGWAAD